MAVASSPGSDDLGSFLSRADVPPGWRVSFQSVVGSTMDVARAAAAAAVENAALRQVFVCDYQTAGRGRQGRRWQAPAGQALLFTVLLRGPELPFLGTMGAAVSLAEAAEQLAEVRSAIKWPNDILVGDRKLAGILAESYVGPPSSHLLVGCGINVNQSAAQLAELGRSATSLLVESGRPVHRGALLLLVLQKLDIWLAIDAERRDVALRRAWQERLWGLGRVVRIRDVDGELEARIERVDPDGALVVRELAGGWRRVVAGEIVL